MKSQILGSDKSAKLVQIVRGQHLATLSIFKTHELRSGEVKVIRFDGLIDLILHQFTTRIEGQGLWLNAAQYCGPTALKFVTVRFLTRNVLMSTIALTEQR